MQDFAIPWMEANLLVAEHALRELRNASVSIGCSVAVESTPTVKLTGNYYEIQVDEFASIVSENNEIGSRCPGCGFLLAAEKPRKFVLQTNTIPRDTDLFRLAEFPFVLIASERFCDFLTSRGYKGISFEPVKLDTKKPTVEMLRPSRGVKPEAWPLHREPKALCKSKAVATVPAPPRKAPEFAEVLKSRLPKHAEALLALAKPAVAIAATEVPNGQPTRGISRFGGLPDVAEDFKWPKRGRQPLTFLAQIVLTEAAPFLDETSLPKKGCLWFFYDMEEQPWGLEPDDRDGWRVVFAPVEGTELKRAALPRGLDEGNVLPESKLTFARSTTLPARSAQEVQALELSKAEEETYKAILGESQTLNSESVPLHQLAGHPAPVQSGDMRIECQLRLEGIGSEQEEEWAGAKGNEIRSAAMEWELLLQLDTNQVADFSWGDAERLYFWICKQDLADNRSDRCWLILQSH